MKRVILLLSVFLAQNLSAAEVLDTKLIALSSDKAVYSAGESAVLRAQLLSKPNNPNFDFDVVATLNGDTIAVDRVTDFELFSTAKELTAGNYSWTATLVLQDARYARDLKAAIQYYSSEIERLTNEIAEETDPQAIANLEKKKARAEALKAASENELASIRTAVLAPQTISFQVL